MLGAGDGPMFENFDAVFLARLQFAFTISFHFIFPAFTIGLASYLAVLEALWLRTKKQVYVDLFRFWVKIFAVAFAMGVVSGIVMTYQFGTNWAVFSDRAGPIIGPLMAYEVMTAFFLEAGFLGVMLFIGDFGDLKTMIDFVASTGQKVLQLLPINDTTITHTWLMRLGQDALTACLSPAI